MGRNIIRLGVALAALALAACSSEKTAAPATQVAADADADLIAASLGTDFLEAQGALGAAMGMQGMPVYGTGAGYGLMSGTAISGGGMMGGGMMGGFGTPGTGTMTMGLTGGGMNVNRTITFYDKAGVLMPKYDSLLTAKVVSDEKMSGSNTMTINGNSRAMTIDATHHTEVTGLEGKETQVSINGSGTSKVSTTLTKDAKTVTTTVNAADATVNLVVPVPRSRTAYPKSGTTSHERTMTASDGTNTVTRSFKEVTTFDGSATAKVTITANGQVKNCTRALDTGRLTCS